MRLNKPKKIITRHNIILLCYIGFVLIALAGLVYFLEKNRITNFIKDPFYVNTNIDSEIATKNDPTIKNKTDTVNTPGVNSNKTTNEIPVSSDITISIKDLTQADGKISANLKIDNASDNGLCSFTFTKENAKPVVRSTSTKTNSCSITIPELEFEMLGKWILEARYFANENQATANGEINIK